jgi:hypothetical protein
LYTYDEEGYAEEGAIYLQLKASEKWRASGDNFVFDMNLRDCMRWTREPMPVILVLFDASQRRAYWLYVQRYFATHPPRKLDRGGGTVRVRIPKRQAVTRSAIRRMRAYKQRVLDQLEGAIDHA